MTSEAKKSNDKKKKAERKKERKRKGRCNAKVKIANSETSRRKEDKAKG